MELEARIKMATTKKILNLSFLLFIFGLLFFICIPKLKYTLSKPKQINTLEELVNSYENDELYVILNDVAVYDSGYDIIMANQDGTNDGHYSTYFFILTEDGVIPIELSPEYISKETEELDHVTIRGIIKLIPDEFADSVNDIAETIQFYFPEFELNEIKELIPPLKIDTVDKSITYYGVLTWISLLGFSFSILVLAKYIAELANYRYSKSYRNLDEYGDPDKIEAEINNEIKNGDIYFESKNLLITKTYIIATEKNFFIKPLSQLRMAYTFINRVRYHLIINKTCYFIYMYFANENHENKILMKSEAECEEILASILGKVPAIIGYDKGYVKMYKKNPDDFNDIIVKIENYLSEINTFSDNASLKNKESQNF